MGDSASCCCRWPVHLCSCREGQLMDKREELAARFWSYVDMSGECWVWTGARNSKGYGRDYGRFGVSGRMILAHRVAWELADGPVPAGMFVLHRCDNPPCVRRTHLFLGTNRDNALDREAKCRGASTKGEQNGRAALTADKVREIRKLCQAGVLQNDLATRFGVSHRQISYIISGTRWKHIGREEDGSYD